MNLHFRLLLLLVILSSLIIAQENPPRLEILHPKPDMQFWVDRIEVAGKVPTGTEVMVAGTKVVPDEEGLFRHLINLDQPEVLIPISETKGTQIFNDTIRVYHRNLDHMGEDSVFINNNIPEELSIHMGYPRSGNFRGSEVSLRGRTHPEALLFMNGDTVKVFESGAFTRHVEINHGDNEFEFIARLNDIEVRELVTLSRPMDREVLTVLDKKSAKPNRDRWAIAGDHLQLSIHGPESESVHFKIPGITGWIKMNEDKLGYYTYSYHLLDIDEEINTKVLYRLGSLSKRVGSAPLRILTDALGGLTIDEDTRVYDTPDTDQLLFPLADSVSLQIIGLENRMYRIRLGQYRTAYVLANRVELHPDSKLTNPHYLGSMHGENEDDWAVFRIRTGTTRLPYEIKEKARPARLELKVYGAKQGWEWTTYPEGDSVIAYLERSQPEDLVWQMDFYPKNSFWGWYGRYEGEYFVIGIRKAPEISRDSLFANVKIEIDPGHGGWQRGARGITGYAEADANLRYSLKLEKLLLDAGATVFLTRRDDHQISLADRAKIAREDSVHIFVMAHNNAPGASRNILEAKGASTFYTWPSAKGLSDKLYPHMHNMGIETSGKVARYYYYLTRQTEYLVYLIEGAFMTNPEEEMFLLSEEGLDALAQAAFYGLEEFLLEKAEQP
ncbi:MAG: N-acetylmuramoyl-L-alanine amidase [FCB group bacterium]|nr:N-acetylmuramoyl-L-alanine amidase [FCB group bacterium]MBL7026900.1 N-acetylmuramoyl-L-alanine amidase [Candidatus Neomarinimicrobiota bacterium]MBL7120483.1 N-acetylmuramoyl-L-alanine amidase [Candidatus Neomarinimicrobiota bacterium]